MCNKILNNSDHIEARKTKRTTTTFYPPQRVGKFPSRKVWDAINRQHVAVRKSNYADTRTEIPIDRP